MENSHRQVARSPHQSRLLVNAASPFGTRQISDLPANCSLFPVLVPIVTALPVAKFVNARPGIVRHPIEPVIIQNRNPSQLASAEFASSCLPGEIPFTAGFSINHRKRAGVWFEKEFQLASLD